MSQNGISHVNNSYSAAYHRVFGTLNHHIQFILEATPNCIHLPPAYLGPPCAAIKETLLHNDTVRANTCRQHTKHGPKL
jgi:hypothetical protein